MSKSQQFVTLASLSLILANNITGTQHKKEIPEPSTFSLHLKFSYSFLSYYIFTFNYLKKRIKVSIFYLFSLFFFFCLLYLYSFRFPKYKSKYEHQMDQNFSTKNIGLIELNRYIRIAHFGYLYVFIKIIVNLRIKKEYFFLN